MTFKDGGAFDFHATFERVKETLSQAIDVARESGQAGNTGTVDLSTVHLEQLPAYEEIGEPMPATAPQIQRPIPVSPPRNRRSAQQQNRSAPEDTDPQLSVNHGLSNRPFQPPSEPPPGYEEAQQTSVVNNLEANMRGSQ